MIQLDGKSLPLKFKSLFFRILILPGFSLGNDFSIALVSFILS